MERDSTVKIKEGDIIRFYIDDVIGVVVGPSMPPDLRCVMVYWLDGQKTNENINIKLDSYEKLS
tara:strand:- start:5817 stop:6008 length:192 start_codon:yes stop_codon:yes gene_type:complete